MLILLLSATLCGYSCLHNYFLPKKEGIVVFHFYSHSCILLNQDGYGFLLKNTLNPLPEEHLTPYMQRHKLQFMPVVHGVLHPQMFYDGKLLNCTDDSIYIIDKQNIQPKEGIWIVTDNTYPRQLQTSSTSSPRLVILDGSCRSHCVQQWEILCQKRQIQLRTSWQEGDIHLPLHSKKRQNKMLK